MTQVVTAGNEEPDTFSKFIILELLQKLRNEPNVVDLKIDRREGSSRLAVRAWEQNAGIKLPSDMKDFYSTTDGLSITWKWVTRARNLNLEMNHHNDNQCMNITSELGVNSLSNLRKLHLTNRILKIGESCFVHPKLDVDHHLFDLLRKGCKITAVFEISHHNKFGKVCIIYKISDTNDTISSIWLIDVAGGIHFLAENFSVYYRMLLVHFGIDKWQMIYTSYGVNTTTRKIMTLLIPKVFHEASSKNAGNGKKIKISKNAIDVITLKISLQKLCKMKNKKIL